MWGVRRAGPDGDVGGRGHIRDGRVAESICLTWFNDGGREAFHTHAFNALSWLLKGELEEERLVDDQSMFYRYGRFLQPKVTRRDHLHRVKSNGTSWVLSLRGPWADTWYEVCNGEKVVLTHGRQEV